MLLVTVFNLKHSSRGLQTILQIQLVIVPLSKEIMNFLAWYARLSDSVLCHMNQFNLKVTINSICMTGNLIEM